MRFYTTLISFVFLATGYVFTSCNKVESLPELTVPGTYEGSKFSSYTVQEVALINNLDSLVKIAKSGEGGEEVNVRDLGLAFSTNSPSLKSVTTPYFTSLLEGTVGYFEKLSKASTHLYTPTDSPGSTGGIYGGYLFDGNGVEPAELITKGLLGAALYRYGLNLYIQNPNINNPATADQLLAVYGANPGFPNSPNASRPDRAVAASVARHDKNDGNGIYSKIKQNFLKLQAAYTAGDSYAQQRDQAYSDILTLWEKGQAAAAMYACHKAVELMSAAAPSEANKAEALHHYSEIIGYLLGFKSIQNKTIPDARIDELLDLLNFQPQGTSSAYKLVTDPAREVVRVKEVIAKLKETYSFSDQEIEDLKKDWVSVQSR